MQAMLTNEVKPEAKPEVHVDPEHELRRAALDTLARCYSATARLKTVTDQLHSCVLADAFQYLSKEERNKKIQDVNELAGEIFDLSKLTTKRIKKIKRTKIPEAILDRMIITEATTQYGNSQPVLRLPNAILDRG